MNNQTITSVVISLFAGAVLSGTIASYAVNHSNQGMMQTFGMHLNSTNSCNSKGMMGNDMMDHSSAPGDMTINNMVSELNGRTGDDFDKAFIAEMITHHQGAINMAKLATSQAKHPEVKDMANNIISAQTTEVTEMQAWQKQWGY